MWFAPPYNMLLHHFLQDYIFPEHAGYPFGEGEEEIRYLQLEIHYDNPSLTPGETTL